MAKPHANDDERNRGWDDQMAPELGFAGAKRAGDFLQIAIDVFDALIGVNQDREDHEEENNDDFRRNLEAEPKHDQWHHRHHRHRIKRIDINIRGPLHQGEAAHHDAKKNADDHR